MASVKDPRPFAEDPARKDREDRTDTHEELSRPPRRYESDDRHPGDPSALKPFSDWAMF